MEGLLAYWKPLAIFLGFIAVLTVFRPGQKTSSRPGDMSFFLVLMLLALGGILFYYRDRL